MTLIQRLAARKSAIEAAKSGATEWFSDRRDNVEANRIYHILLEKQQVQEATPGMSSVSLTTVTRSPLEIVVDILNQLKAEVAAVTEDNRIQFAELIQFLVRAMRLLNEGLAQFKLSPTDMKDSILLAIDEFYSRVIAPLDIPFLPDWIENKFVDPVIGTWMHEAASGLYDALFPNDPKFTRSGPPTIAPNPTT